jgi:hypothetical protein
MVDFALPALQNLAGKLAGKDLPNAIKRYKKQCRTGVKMKRI